MSTIVKKTIDIGKKKIAVMAERYNSANEVVADCEKRKITDSDFEDVTKATGWEWRGVESYEDALNLMRFGYQPTVEKLKGQLKVSRMGNGKRIAFVNDVVGAVPVVPLALMGIPNSMIDMRMKPIKCKVVDVYYDMTMSCGTDSETIIANGQKLLGAVLELERQGYRFNLYGVQSYYRDDSADILTVRVKSANQPINLKRMSFPLTHTGFFRVIGFDWYSKTPEGKFRFGYGHALGYDLNDKDLREFGKKMFGDNAIYIAASRMNDETEEHLKGVLSNDKG